MTTPSRQHPLLTLVAAIGALAGGAMLLRTGSDRVVPNENTAQVSTSAASPAAANASSMLRTPNSEHPPQREAPVFSQSMIDLARSTSWDKPASAALEHVLLATFDADADGTLNDLERITAVQTLRDAMWPPANETLAAWEDEPSPDEDAQGPASPAALTQHDRRLLHDVDQTRRFERQESGDVGDVEGDLRAEIVRRFRLDDDARLTPAEFARYMAHRNAGASLADVNADSRIDDADLRLFLDVASPIDGSEHAP